MAHEDARRAQLASFFAHLDAELRASSGLPETVVELAVAGGGRWRVETRDGTGAARALPEGAEGEPAQGPEPACRVQTDLRTLDKLANGELRPAMALLRGKVSYSGSYGVLRDLQGPFRRAAEKVMAELGPDSVPIATFVLDKNNPAWESDADRCKLCLTRFTFWTRQHHCRRCGAAVCGNCSAHQIKGYRACSACWQQHIKQSPSSPKTLRGRAASTPQAAGSRVKAAAAATAATEGNVLPYQRLIEHMRSLQARPIAAAVESSAMTVRALLLRIRKLEETVHQHAQSSLPALLSRFARFIGPKALLTGALALAWAFPSNLLSLGLIILNWDRPVLLGLAWLPFQPSPLQSFSALATARPFATTAAVATALVVNLARYFFGRLLRIYSTAFVIIFTYYATYLIFVRAMGMGTTASTRVFEALDVIMAPFACNEILALRSVFVKFGQYIGSRADIIPPRWAVVLAKLQDDLPADRFKYVERCIEEQFGHKIDKIFESFDPEPMASASIAQVHRAVLRPNVLPSVRTPLEVAVKVQHEGIEAIMRSDVVAFRRIIRLIAWLNPRFAVAKTLLRAWETEMLKELDFHVEAANLRTVRGNLRQAGLLVDADDDYLDAVCAGSHVLVPRPVRALVGKRAFCMTFVHGFKITDLEQLALFGVDRSALVKRVVQAYGCMIFVDGFTSADPHPGNLMVSVSDNGVARPILLDFGMVVTLQETTRVGYCKLVNSIANISVSGLSEAIASIGYKNSQSEAHPERDLEFFAHLLRDTGDRKSQRQSQAQFRKRRKAQRAADLEQDPDKEGRYFADFPDSLIFLFRVLGLIRGLCTTLDAPISYVDILGDYAKLGLMHHELQRAADAVAPAPSPSSTPAKAVPTQAFASLQAKVADLLKQTQLEGSRDLADFADHGFAVDGFLGAQVCVVVGQQLAVDAFAGVQGELSPLRVAENTLFPLLDISRSLPVLELLSLIGEGKLLLSDRVAQHWKAFANKDLMVADLLTYAGNAKDLVRATTSSNLLRDYDALKQKFEDESAAKPPRADRRQSKYTVFSFGYLVSGLLEAVVGEPIDQILAHRLESLNVSDAAVYLSAKQAPKASARFADASNGFAGFVRSMAMGGGAGQASAAAAASSTTASAPVSSSMDELGRQTSEEPLPQAATDRVLEETFGADPKSVSASPKSAASPGRMIRTKAAYSLSTSNSASPKVFKSDEFETNRSEGDTTIDAQHDEDPQEEKAADDGENDDPEDEEEEEEHSPLPPGVRLPAGAMLDPCCVNSKAVRESVVPSFGAFGTARGLARVVDAFFAQKLPPALLKRVIRGSLREESSPLYGKLPWTLGFQLFVMPDTGVRVLVQQAFGGSILVTVPERKVTMTVLVNCLTLDRALTRELLALVCRELQITKVGVDQLFGGMF